MNKKILIGVIILFLVSIGFYLATPLNKEPGTEKTNSPAVSKTFDPKNFSFNFEGTLVTLKNGKAETQTGAGETEKITINYFGNEAVGDLNGDGLSDVAFLFTENSGGTGTFYYAIVALKTDADYVLTNPFFIGDRIAPQTNQINESAKELYINYAERKAGEPMVAQPSVGATKILIVTPEGKLQGLMQ